MKIGWATSAVQTPGGAVIGSVPAMSRITGPSTLSTRACANGLRTNAAHSCSGPVEVVDVAAGAADERPELPHPRCARSQSATSGRVM